MKKKTVAPSQAEILAAALTVLRLGGLPGAGGKQRVTWDEGGSAHVFAAHWKKTQHTCPKCGHKGPVNGTERKQSWCADCRATTNYYKPVAVDGRTLRAKRR